MLAILFIGYGILKITVSLMTFFLPDDTRKKLANKPIVKDFIQDDKTAAGHAIHYALLFFGIFTFVHGLALLSFMPPVVIRFVESTVVHCVINGVIGLFLFIFYILVLFTNVKISKNERYTSTYKLVGLGGGILFMAAVPGILLYDYLTKNKDGHNSLYIIALCIIMFTMLTPFFYILYISMLKGRNLDEIPWHEILTVLMIPLNFV